MPPGRSGDLFSLSPRRLGSLSFPFGLSDHHPLLPLLVAPFQRVVGPRLRICYSPPFFFPARTRRGDDSLIFRRVSPLRARSRQKRRRRTRSRGMFCAYRGVHVSRALPTNFASFCCLANPPRRGSSLSDFFFFSFLVAILYDDLCARILGMRTGWRRARKFCAFAVVSALGMREHAR